MSSTLYLAFCDKNRSVATNITKQLAKGNFSFLPLSSKSTKENEGITFLIAESNAPGILLLSDNLLKDETCMLNMLNFIQTSSKAETMQVVVIDGQYATGDVETSFDRVSSVIKYMNYWQEKYLEMRKKKRTIDPSKEEAFNENLLNVKHISSEIGDFLRLIRNKDYWTFDQMVFNNYEIFFKKFSSSAQHQAFNKLIGNAKPVVAPPVTVAAAPPIAVPPPIVHEKASPQTNEIPKIESDQVAIARSQITPPSSSFVEETVADINTAFQAKPVTLHEKVAAKLNQTVENNIPNPDLEIEEKEINEVLEEVNYLETEHLISAKEKSELPEIGNRLEIKPIVDAAPIPKTLNDLFSEKEKTTEKDNEPIEEVQNIEIPKVEDTIEPEVPMPVQVETVDISQEMETFEEEEMVTEIDIPETEEIVINPVIEEVVEEEILDSVNGLPTEVIEEEEEEEDFDVMDGIDVEEISDYNEAHKNDDEEEEEDIEEIFSDLEDIYTDENIESYEEIDEIEEEEIIEEIIQEYKEVDVNSMLNDANALMISGAYEEGKKAFESILKSQPDNLDFRYQYAKALREEANDTEGATTEFEKIIRKDKTHCEAYKALAEISEQNNDFLLAKSYFEKVVYLKPEEKGIYYKLGLITAGFYAEKPKLAVKYFRKAIQQNPNNEDAYYRLALIESELMGKNKKAIANFHKTLRINPKHPFANYDLALLYHKVGDQKNASIFYGKANDINSELKTPENDIAFHYEAGQNLPPDAVELPGNLYTRSVDNDKVILITGATSGIGRATAQIFAEHGFKIIITGRRSDRLEEIKSDFEKNYKSKVKTLEFDVRNIEEVKAMINSLDKEWRNIDVLINNAGLAKGYSPIHEGELEHWETMIDTNIKGLLYLTRAVAPHMVKRQSGHIINVCSTAGKEVYTNGNVYCATKHAVDALTKAMRLDLYKYNIKVGQVSPAHVEETEFAYVRFEDQEKAKIYNDFQPLKSSDVADAIFYIATSADHVNVQDILLMGKQQANSSNIDRSGRE